MCIRLLGVKACPPAIASAHAHFLVFAKVAHRVVPGHIQSAFQAQLPEFILPHPIVVHKWDISTCMGRARVSRSGYHSKRLMPS